ncbi:hypothetical protein F4782DRAFT_511338 [Xylaria castorea]|nr:hypothetical protein F4782DRAFT_511338 [Xylaria castorea]
MWNTCKVDFFLTRPLLNYISSLIWKVILNYRVDNDIRNNTGNIVSTISQMISLFHALLPYLYFSENAHLHVGLSVMSPPKTKLKAKANAKRGQSWRYWARCSLIFLLVGRQIPGWALLVWGWAGCSRGTR